MAQENESYEKAEITLNYKTGMVDFVLHVPSRNLFLTPEIADIFGSLLKAEMSMTDVLKRMAVMIEKIDHAK